MATKVEIYNLALSHIGEPPVKSPTERSAGARAINVIYNVQLQAMLRSFPWSFNQDTKQLVQDTTIESPDYKYVYALPAEFSFMTRIVAANGNASVEWDYDKMAYIGLEGEWRIRSGRLHCNIAAPIIEYQVLITDETMFDVLFADALGWRLASQIALPITKKPAVQQGAIQAYLMALRIARGMDGAQSKKKLRVGEEWIRAKRRR